MSEEGGLKETAIAHVKKKMRLFSIVVMVINFVFFFLVLRFTYEFLDYIPVRAAVFVFAGSAMLATLMLYAAKSAGTKAIRAIEDFGGKLDLLLESSRKIHEIGHSDMLIDSIMSTALRMTGAEGGSLLLVEGDRLVFSKVMGSKSSSLSGVAIPMDKGIAARVVATGVPLRVDDAHRDDRFYPVVDEALDHETRSVLCVPLKIGAGVIGALEIINKRVGAFTAEDEELMMYFSGHAARSFEAAKFAEDEKNYEIHFTNILLEAIDGIMPEKVGHSKRVAKYSLIIAKALGLADDEKKRLYRASLLHDIGFLRVKDLKSIGELRKHPEHARDMLGPINFYSDVVPSIFSHHERWDGKGYPAGLAGEAIPIGARIISIAEAFDSMVSRHSYKAKAGEDGMLNSDVLPNVVDFESAMGELMKNAGTQFDRKLVELFANNITLDDLEGA